MAIPLPGGVGEITDYDADTITVAIPGQQPLRVARAAAPASLQAAVQQAEQAAPPVPAAAAPAGPQANPMGFLEGAPQVIAPPAAAPPQRPTRLQQSFEQLQTSQAVAPVAEPVAEPMEPGEGPDDQLEAAAASLEEQMAASVGRGGGGASRTSTQTTQIDPAARGGVMSAQDEIDQARQEQSVARDYGAQAQSDEASQVADLRGAQAGQLDSLLRQEQADKAEHARRYEAEDTKLKSLQVEADSKIDPKRWWKEKSTGENILAALAMGLGAMGAALTGGQNYALQIIDKAIERDIDSQLANRDSKGKAAARQMDLIGLVKDQYATKREERQAARVLGLERTAQYIEQVTARSASEQTKAKGIEMGAQLREQSAKEHQALVMQLAGTVTTSKTATSGGGAGTSKADVAARAREAVYGKYDPEAFIPGAEKIFGVPMQAAGGKGDATDLNKQVAAANDLMRTLDMMEASAKGGKLSPQARTNVDSLRAQAMLKIKNLESGGALDAGMQAIAEDMLGPKGTNITTITSAAPQLKTNIRASLRNNLSSRAQRVDPQRVPLAHRSRFAPGGQGANAPPPATRSLAETD